MIESFESIDEDILQEAASNLISKASKICGEAAENPELFDVMANSILHGYKNVIPDNLVGSLIYAAYFLGKHRDTLIPDFLEDVKILQKHKGEKQC